MYNETDEHQEIRDAVRQLCRQFPDEYFRKVDEKAAYPEAFVTALIEAGWLAAMIPEEYGGTGLGLTAATVIMEEINRSGVQLAAAEGTAKNTDFALFGASYGWAAGGAAGGYSSTPEGKIIIAAFADSYNQLVKVVRNYRAQTVKGGLGTGGALGVQGGFTPASPK